MPEFEKPKVEALNLAQIFSEANTFMVPTYQREYAWGEEQVEDLTSDLQLFLESDDPYYILGQVILAKNHDHSSGYLYAVVDGQQRMTTLYLLFIALQRQFTSYGIALEGSSSEASMRRHLWQAIYKSDASTVLETQRFQATNLANRAILKLLEDQKLEDIQPNTSALNIKKNFDILTSWVSSSLESVEKLTVFTESLLSRVFLMNVWVGSEKQALSMFEKLNSRGLALSPAALLKALIFQKSNPADFELLNEKWEQAGVEMFKAKPVKIATVQYLMQALLQPELGKFVASSEIDTEWRKVIDSGESRLGDTKVFASEILNSAKSLTKIASPTVNESNEALAGSKFFNAIQQYPVVLEAWKNLQENPDDYHRLTTLIDARIVLSLFAEERPQELNPVMWRWSKQIRDVGPGADFREYATKLQIDKNQVSDLLARARTNLKLFDYSNSRDRKRIRFALAYIAYFVERKSHIASPSMNLQDLLVTNSKVAGKYDIDHITPQNAVTHANFDKSSGVEWVDRIGNLCLFHSKDNRRSGAIFPTEKSPDYATSKLLLTNLLALPSDTQGLSSGRGVASEGASYLRNLGAQDVDGWSREKAENQADFYSNLFDEAIRTNLFI